MSDQTYIQFLQAGQTVCTVVMVLSVVAAGRAVLGAFKEQE